MAKRSFMSGKSSEAMKVLGKKSSTPNGAKSIFKELNLLEIQKNDKNNNFDLVQKIFSKLHDSTVGLWSTIFSKDIKAKGNEIEFSLVTYEIAEKDEKRPLIATFSCAKYFAAILNAAKTLDIIDLEINGNTIKADKDELAIYVIIQETKPTDKTE